MEPKKIIRRREVCARSGYSHDTIDRLEKLGKFPARVRLSDRAVGWFEDEINDWIKSRIRGGGKRVRDPRTDSAA